MAVQEATETLLNFVNKLEPLIREYADEAERNRCLSQPVVDALAEAGFFRLYTPRTLGGLEVNPLTFTRVVEALARIDGSTAWCVWLASTNPLFVPNLADTAVEEIFGTINGISFHEPLSPSLILCSHPSPTPFQGQAVPAV